MKNYNIDEELKHIKELSAYEIKDISDIEEISAKAVVLEHKKTKARVFTLLSDDDNKVFTIGFRSLYTLFFILRHLYFSTYIISAE